MLQPFGEEIWIASGPIASVAGFRFPTRMAVIRLSDGALFVWSPTALTDALKTAVDALGEVRHIVAPSTLHDLFLGDWRIAYPQAEMLAPPGLRGRRRDLAFDGDLEDSSVHGWSTEIDHVPVHGSVITTEVVFFHHRSRTAIFTDLIQHFEPGWFSGWRAVVARLDLMTAPEPEVPRKFRQSFVNRGAAREALRRILAWPTEKVLMAHAPPVEAGGRAFVAKRFRWLLKG